MEELAGRPEAGAALEVAALLRRAWAGARASEAEVRGAHVPRLSQRLMHEWHAL